MWTARCSYIRRLHPPNSYSNIMEFMYRTTLNQSELFNSKYACLKPNNQSPNHLGLGHYALERWYSSHPDVRPCNVVHRVGQISPDFPQTWAPDLRRAPHEKPKQIGIQFGPYKTSFAVSILKLVFLSLISTYKFQTTISSYLYNNICYKETRRQASRVVVCLRQTTKQSLLGVEMVPRIRSWDFRIVTPMP
jgi:hypothetical protein